MIKPWVCAECGQRIDDPWDRFERRIEFRSCRTQGREHVLLDKHVCRGCMRAEVESSRPKDQTASLFGGGA